jgi:hypothetical protein
MQRAQPEQKEFNSDKLPQLLKDKFAKLSQPMTFDEKSELLGWFTDSMKAEVFNHFETEGKYEEMSDQQRSLLVDQLEKITNDC